MTYSQEQYTNALQKENEKLKEEYQTKLEDMSDEALINIISMLGDELVKRNKKVKKQNYKLVEQEVDYKKFYNLAMERLRDIVPAAIKGIKEDSLIKLQGKDLYPCPKCGKMTLTDVTYYDSLLAPTEGVKCNNCNFEVDRISLRSNNNVWGMFHAWLVKNGYLDV